jgi:hypothetical protein
MKKIKLLISVLTLVFVSSCTSDGGTSVQKLTSGAVPKITKLASADSGINLIAINNGLDINLGLTVDKEDGNVQSMDIVGFYSKSGVVSKAYLKKAITTFPSTVSFNKAALIDAFASLNSNADFKTGDGLTISAEITLTDGTVTKVFKDDGTPSYGSGLLSIYKNMFQTYDITCPLNDASNFNGNYKVTKDGWNDYSAASIAAGTAIVPIVYDPLVGAFVFTIKNTNNPSLVNGATTTLIVTINPTDSTLTAVSGATVWSYGSGPANQFTVSGTGTVNSCNGAINLKLIFTDGNNDVTPEYEFNLVKA